MTHPTPHRSQDGTTGGSLSESSRYELLANERRRRTLAILAERDEAISLEELASELANRAGDESGAAGATDAAIGLHHIHLPKLDTVGLIDYDPETHNVEPHVTEPAPNLE